MSDPTFMEQVEPLLDPLMGAAMRLTKNRAEAEDLLQDTLVRAFRFWHSYEQGTNLKAWMFTILRNTFTNRYHRENRKQNFEHDVSSEVEVLGSSVAVCYSTSRPPEPEEVAEARQTKSAVQRALEAMPENYRQPVEMFELKGLSYKEIAEEMQCPIGTVMSRIYRGRKLLHKLLYEHARELRLVEDVG